MQELLGFFDRLINIRGTAVFEAVQEDPQTIEFIASRSRHEDGPYKMPLYGFTDLMNILTTLVEVQVGKPLPRPKLPALEERKNRIIAKTKSAVELAQERSARKSKRK